MKIKLGYSLHFDADQILQKLDLDPEDPEERSFFEQVFDSELIDPESYEVYGRDDVNGPFTSENLPPLFPFDFPANFQWPDNLDECQSVFFIISDHQWTRHEAEGIVIFKELEIEKFKY